jgi:F-type H+-transporting ATPase subunit epsilon
MAEKLLDVTVLSPEKIVFQGKAERVIVPGESGVFEVLPFHKRLLSRLLAGTIVIDKQLIPIYRGVVQVGNNAITIIMEKERA